MPLKVGAHLGSYEILSAIGAGGMGEVYRARDTKLNRDIALKVLPESFALDPDRLARFRREAQVLASLNHPNIAQIYGLEGQEGRDGQDGSLALVMELVEGPTLSEVLAGSGLSASASGPVASPKVRSPEPKAKALPIPDALHIAKQIADALEAAHEQGIIHRDLKPANIKVRDDGTVKVLDFGLAKALDPAPAAGASASMSPTLSIHATMEGVILGTAAYMSPEQARGRPVDRRADIWAFGVVLYEMLAGRRTFDGEDVSITMAGVLKSDPDWTALPADLPSGLRKLLRRCLEKDPRQRLQSIGDARLELSDIAAGQSEASGAATLPQVAAAPRSGRALPWTLALAGFAGLVVVALMHFREPPAVAAAELRTEIVTPSTLDPTAFALSPDGKQMAFVASVDGQTRLWLRALNASAAQPLPGTDGAAFPFWSPDSRSIGFFADGKLKRLTIGSAAQAVTGPNFAVVARGGSWNGEGVILFARNTRSAIFRVPASGGEPVAVSTIEAGTGHRFPYFLPDGRHFLFSVLGSSAVNGIYLGTLDGSESTRLVTVGGGDTGAVYLPPGWMLWVHSGTLVAQRLDVEKRTMIGDPVTIAEQVAYDAGTQAGALSVSATGLISYRLGGASHRQLRWFDRAGKALGPLGAPDEGLFAPRVSPDGRRAAVYRNFQNTLDIWLMDETRLSRLTFDAVQHRFPIWSPDGSQVAFDAVRKQARDLYVGSPARPGGESLLLESSEDKFASDWSADGRFLLYTSASPQTNADMWVLPLIGERKPWPFLQTPAGEKLGQFSPDGRWIAYMSNDSGMNEVYVRPFVPSPSANASGAGERWQISSGGGMHPKWRADGKELFFVGPEGQMMGAPIAASGSAIEPGKPVVLFQTRIYGGGIDNGQGSQFDVARDGRFLINTVLDESASAITLLQNWKAR